MWPVRKHQNIEYIVAILRDAINPQYNCQLLADPAQLITGERISHSGRHHAIHQIARIAIGIDGVGDPLQWRKKMNAYDDSCCTICDGRRAVWLRDRV